MLGKLIEAWQAGRAFTVTGTDWPTRDGSGLRDYVHVWDLARAHVAALQADLADYEVINLGTGQGTTVFELADAVGLSTMPQGDFYDVVIIGGGPAGLGAAVYAASEGLKSVVL